MKAHRRFGVIRVINDDIVQPERGFGTHPHRDMEIMTYIVEGQLTHEDSLGNVESIGRGSVQFMTAGTGVEHSEYNHSPDTPFRCIQTWIVPSAYDLKPRYGSFRRDPGHVKKNELVHLASDIQGTVKTPIQVYQDLDCFVAELEKGAQVQLEIPDGRQAYLVCIEGSIRLDPNSGDASVASLQKFDACEIITTGSRGGELIITAVATEETENGPLAHFIAFVMARSEYAGRKDF
jgi:redox-sensitive bicupin YhaK (pirin superfamily)